MVLCNSLLELAHSVDGIILILGPDGTIRKLAASNGDPLREARQTILGRKLRDVVGEESYRPFRDLLEYALESGNGENVEYSAQMSDGEHWFRIQSAPALDAFGTSQLVCLHISDVTESRHADEKLQKSEALLARAEKLADIGSWEYDVQRRDFAWSPHFFEMLGLEPQEKKVTVEEACPSLHPEDQRWLWSDVARLVATGEPLDNEVRFVRPDGKIRTFHTRAVPIKDPDGQVVKIAGMSQDITERKETERALRELSRGLLNLRDEERRRMARDLHETAVQSLAALKMGLARLGEALTDKASLAYALYQSSSLLTDDATREVRTVAYLMHPPTLDMAGLDSALRWFAKGFGQRSHIATKVEVPEGFGRLPQEIETTIFRVVQEALTNVHKHSRSPTALIRLRREPRAVICEVEDRGKGMPPVSTANHLPKSYFGVGIAGMRERIQQLKGTFEIESTPESGTTLRITIPLPERSS